MMEEMIEDSSLTLDVSCKRRQCILYLRQQFMHTFCSYDFYNHVNLEEGVTSPLLLALYADSYSLILIFIDLEAA